ncbi:MAG: nucleotidyltransferase domain-containing protein [Victivallales bacterium]|jgi:predicted nucleotidyltransferase|nr:nucleotidyltransferase domain-containing protein [Victivallales bacterium]MBT7163286.1 nucleotidyltransferase domain-containing protein [Victivallales bacterium]MBT7304383.1 nucleotidyltransferase domain-containing protein [Victivallales bacterium]
MDHELVLTKLIDEILGMDPTCSIFAIGSVAAGDPREDSDLDLFVYFAAEPPHFTTHITAENRGRMRIMGYLDGIKIDIGWRLESTLPTEFPPERAVNWYPLANPRILHDPRGTVKRVLALVHEALDRYPWIAQAWEKQLAEVKRHKLDPSCDLQFDEPGFYRHMAERVAQRRREAGADTARRT